MKRNLHYRLPISLLILLPLMASTQNSDYLLQVWDSTKNQGIAGVTVEVSGYGEGEERQFESNQQGVVSMSLTSRPAYKVALTHPEYLKKVMVLKDHRPKERIYLTLENDTVQIDSGDRSPKVTNASLPLLVDMKNPPQRNEFEERASRDQYLSEQLGLSKNRRVTGLRRIPSLYSGWTIEVMNADSGLSPEHPLLQRYDSVYWEKEKSGTYSYFVGSYLDFDEAYEFFEKYLQEEYPGAIMCEYIDGVRQ